MTKSPIAPNKQALRQTAEKAQEHGVFNMDIHSETVLALLDENLQLQRDKDSLEAVAIAMRDDMREAREKLEAAESKSRELMAENADLKHAMAVTLEHVSVTDAGQAGVAAMIINDALHHSETPATDAFLAEVRAQGVEMFADFCGEENSVFVEAKAYYRSLADAVDEFAAQLRQGAAHE